MSNQGPSTAFEAVLFDLDGTLLDTAGEIADAVNDTLGHLNYSDPLPRQLVRNWIGKGPKVLLQRALRHCGVPENEVEKQSEQHWHFFYQAYGDRCGTNSTPYPGMRQCLTDLKARGYRLGVLTNKDTGFTHRVLNAHDLQSNFELVTCGDTYAAKKPDPLVLNATLEKLGVVKANALFIGDSMTDVRTGKAAQVQTWAFTHGYHHGQFDQVLAGDLRPDRLLNHYVELQTLLLAEQ